MLFSEDTSPEAREEERRVLFIRRCFGDKLADDVRRWMASDRGLAE